MRKLIMFLLLKIIPKVKYATKLSLITIPVDIKVTSVGLTIHSNFISMSIQGTNNFVEIPHFELDQFDLAMADFNLINSMIKKEKR